MLEIILVQGFCPLKIKITQFPNGLHLLRLKTLKCFQFTRPKRNIEIGIEIGHVELVKTGETFNPSLFNFKP